MQKKEPEQHYRELLQGWKNRLVHCCIFADITVQI